MTATGGVAVYETVDSEYAVTARPHANLFVSDSANEADTYTVSIPYAPAIGMLRRNSILGLPIAQGYGDGWWGQRSADVSTVTNFAGQFPSAHSDAFAGQSQLVIDDLRTELRDIAGVPQYSLLEPTKIGRLSVIGGGLIRRYFDFGGSAARGIPASRNDWPRASLVVDSTSTIATIDDGGVDSEAFEALLRLGRVAELEFGVESVFAERLASFLRAYRVPAVAMLQSRWREIADARPDVAVVMFQVLGDERDEVTRDARFALMSAGLASAAAAIRDAAALALSRLDDPRARAALRQALEREPNRHVRRLLERLVSR